MGSTTAKCSKSGAMQPTQVAVCPLALIGASLLEGVSWQTMFAEADPRVWAAAGACIVIDENDNKIISTEVNQRRITAVYAPCGHLAIDRQQTALLAIRCLTWHQRASHCFWITANACLPLQ